MRSADSTRDLTEQDRQYLLDLALASIRYGIAKRQALAVSLEGLAPALIALRASFVTLHRWGDLRGCIGSLSASRPLAQDVAANAFAAAFRDPRFDPVQAEEVDDLEIHLSLLTAPEPMSFTSEDDLLAQLRPSTDGLILEDRGRRGTFLPSVWEQLPDAREFLRHLKQKAGFAPDYWTETLKVQRYQADSIP